MLDNASGAGAYVHGLEDEFEAVRLAAIDSLCELSLNIPTIADKAVEYLVRECVVKTSPAGEGPVACPKRLEAFASLEALSASPSYPLSHLGAPATSLTHLPSSRMGCGVSQMDMMNDELESVRLNAVQSLSKLATLTTLTQDMVVVLLQALDDPRGPLRRAVYALLAQARVADATCILMAVRRLATALAAFPEVSERRLAPGYAIAGSRCHVYPCGCAGKGLPPRKQPQDRSKIGS
jgi:hypothetical protein